MIKARRPAVVTRVRNGLLVAGCELHVRVVFVCEYVVCPLSVHVGLCGPTDPALLLPDAGLFWGSSGGPKVCVGFVLPPLSDPQPGTRTRECVCVCVRF